MIPARAGRALGVAAVVLVGAVACSSSSGSSGGDDGSSTPATPAGTSPAAPPSSSAVVASSPSTTSAALPTATTAVGSAPASVTSLPAAPKSTCTDVTVRFIQGGAEPGVEIAALQFTNAGTKRCRLVGYSTVQLMLKGKPVGKPSQPSDDTVTSTRRLAPGATAESLLRDFSSCQAPLSDTVRVTAPGMRTTLTRPGRLRACTLRVGPLRQPD